MDLTSKEKRALIDSEARFNDGAKRRDALAMEVEFSSKDAWALRRKRDLNDASLITTRVAGRLGSGIDKEFIKFVDLIIGQLFNGQREFALYRQIANTKILNIAERLSEVESRAPLAYAGTYVPGQESVKGFMYTDRGSLWYCKETTNNRPGDGNNSFQLAVKKGRDAR